MMIPRSLALLLLAATACHAPQSGNDVHTLWDGSDLSGWRMAGPGEFIVEGNTFYAQGGMGLWWYGEKSFKDFELELEWKAQDATDNSGVFVRFPNPGTDPWVAVNEGYEIQICDAAGPKHNTGSIYSFKESSHIPTKPAGEWNHYSIQVVGQNYTIRINGELVNEFVGDRTLEGYIGVQNHDDDSPVRYRNIRVTEL
jgi:hypothetical protein